MKVDLLVFGAHPDDIEIGISGTIAKYTQSGKNVIAVDLTAGEMGSNGNVEIRYFESQRASEILGLSKRINLGIPDRKIYLNDINLKKVIEVIRKYKPKIIFYPFKKDYHPDHEAAHILIREAIHSSGLIKFETGQDRFRPEKSYCYYINDVADENLYVDISDVYETKIGALNCHESQFLKKENTVSTYLNNDFINSVKIRDRYWGTKCGCKFAELLFSDELIEFKV